MYNVLVLLNTVFSFRYLHRGATAVLRKPAKEKPKALPAKPKVDIEKSDLTCEKCNKTLANVNSLAVHRQLHYGLKPFKCDFCTTRFTQKCNMKRHLGTCKLAISFKTEKATPPAKGDSGSSSVRHENSARAAEQPSSPVF